jgi:hypothetical protein
MFREKLIAAVEQKIGNHAKANFPMLLTFFEEAKLKKGLMNFFFKALCESEY